MLLIVDSIPLRVTDLSSDDSRNRKLSLFKSQFNPFGNSPSPPIATLGLRKVAQKAESKYGSHITQFVGKDFYVDNGTYAECQQLQRSFPPENEEVHPEGCLTSLVRSAEHYSVIFLNLF
jgi:hypothetical protein